MAIVVLLLGAPILGFPWLVIFEMAFDERSRAAFSEGFAEAPIFLVFWFAVAAHVLGGFMLLTALWVWDFLWNLFGSEELVVDHSSLTRRWRLGFMSDTRCFQVRDIANVRLSEVRGRRGVRRAIVFEYAGRTVKATFNISRAEAAALLSGPLLGWTSPYAALGTSKRSAKSAL